MVVGWSSSANSFRRASSADGFRSKDGDGSVGWEVFFCEPCFSFEGRFLLLDVDFLLLGGRFLLLDAEGFLLLDTGVLLLLEAGFLLLDAGVFLLLEASFLLLDAGVFLLLFEGAFLLLF